MVWAMTGKTCRKCGKVNLEWDMEYNKEYSKWKLQSHKAYDGKWCVAPIVKKMTKRDYKHCPLCPPGFGWLSVKDSMDDHTKQWHPNGEILTDNDFKCG